MYKKINNNDFSIRNLKLQISSSLRQRLKYESESIIDHK